MMDLDIKEILDRIESIVVGFMAVIVMLFFAALAFIGVFILSVYMLALGSGRFVCRRLQMLTDCL